MQVYLSTLEAVKTWTYEQAEAAAPNPATAAAAANFAAGGTASLITQSVIVPVDVVSQRIMVAGAGSCMQRGACACPRMAGRLEAAKFAGAGFACKSDLSMWQSELKCCLAAFPRHQKPAQDA